MNHSRIVDIADNIIGIWILKMYDQCVLSGAEPPLQIQKEILDVYHHGNFLDSKSEHFAHALREAAKKLF